MADRVEVFDVTVAAGTAIAAPTTTQTPFPDGYVTDVEVVIPAGCKGLVGFQLMRDGSEVVPSTVGGFIRGNDEVIHWPLDNFPVAGRWSIRAYNIGVYNHTLQVRYLINEWTPKTPTGEVLPVPIAAEVP